MNNNVLTAVSTLLLLVSCQGKVREAPASEIREAEKAMVGANRILVKKDQEKIKAYIQQNNLSLEESETGLWYGISKEGTGDKAVKGQVATLAYKVSLLDGTLCYDSNTLGVKEFRIGQGGVEAGLEEGLLMLRVGSKATFIMPPHLAHGLPGDGNKIPARSIIVYDVELLKLQPR